MLVFEMPETFFSYNNVLGNFAIQDKLKNKSVYSNLQGKYSITIVFLESKKENKNEYFESCYITCVSFKFTKIM